MRSLDEEEIQNLTYFASLLYSDSQLAAVMELDADEFRRSMKAQSGEIYRIVTAARMQSESVIRDGIIKMAGRGSTPAQTMALDLLKAMKKDNV